MQMGGALPTMSKVSPMMAKKGASLKKPMDSQKGLKKLPTAVRNKMGYAKKGKSVKAAGMHKMPDGSMMKNSKMKSGGSVKSKTAPKKMMMGGKCKHGC